MRERSAAGGGHTGMRSLMASVLAVVLATGCGQSAGGPSKRAATAEQLPAVARIACTTGGTQLLTPAVRPQSDGLHVMLSQNGGPPATLNSERAGGWKPGPRPFVITLPPGQSHLGCMSMADWNADPPRHHGWVRLRIVDQDRQWVDDRPAGASCSTGSLDYTATATGAAPAMLAALAGKALQASPGDLVERAGYRRQRPIEYRLVRDGVVRGLATYDSDGYGGWLLDSVVRCSSG
jgi:hypothetical protein